MGDAAHVESFDHEVFSKPFTIRPRLRFFETPDNYRRFPDGDKLPDVMKVWYVQKTGKTYGGVVARSYGFGDSPDAEALVPGVNGGKEYGAVGIGRHGNFLLWGYSAPPSKMTGDGRKLFLNCICYINRFDGKAPIVRKTSSDRWNAVRLAALIDRIKDDSFFSGTFAADLKKKYEGDPNGLVRYYRDDFEYIYRDSTFQIDTELKSLGLSSNRTVDTLERLIVFLKDDTHADIARRLLVRYTNQSFQHPDEWESWFQANRDRIFFTDVGEYKFLVVPEGYLDKK